MISVFDFEVSVLERKTQHPRLQVLRRFLKGSWTYFIVCILSGALLTGCEMLIPQIIRITVDSVIGPSPPALPAFLAGRLESIGGMDYFRSHMWLVAGLIGVLGSLAAVFRYLANLYNAKAGETLVKTARDTLYSHIQQLPWSWHTQNATGDIIQRCTSDMEVVKNFFQEQFVSVFRVGTLILLSIACLVSMNFRLSLVVIVSVPIIVTYSVIFHNRIRDRFTTCDENEGILSTIVQEHLTGVRVVRAFGREIYEKERFEAQNIKYTNLWVRLCRTLAAFWSVGDLTNGLQLMLVIVFGTVLCVRGSMTSGEFIAFISYNAMMIWPVRRLGHMIAEMSKAGVSIGRIAAILSSPAERDEEGASEPPMDGDIAFENVSFRYGTGPEVLSDVSFTIPAGQTFGILGGTGAGKSTLVHLLCRLYPPSAGRITVGGQDIASMRARWVRRNVGIVLQEPFLFSRTLGENIGVCGAAAEEIRAAAVTASLDSDIDGFAAGYETLVGERGVTLSGGQKQRVAMARMLTRKTPIIVFDDSLSAVDTETDEKIRMALRKDLRGSTVLYISHRITTLMDCDRILVLDHGRIAELGTHEELYARNGIYRRICDMQMSLSEGN